MPRRLRVFCAIPESANNGALPGSNVWYRNLVEPLIDMGHDVVQPSFSVGEHYRATYAHGTEQQKKARDLYGQRLVEDVRRTHSEKPLDLVLTYYDSFQLSSRRLRSYVVLSHRSSTTGATLLTSLTTSGDCSPL